MFFQSGLSGGGEEGRSVAGLIFFCFFFVFLESFTADLVSFEKNNPRGREKGQPVLIVIITVC